MKNEIENKLEKIANIWNHFIWEYQFCNNQIKFTDEVKTNYFGDILGYFQDTFDVVFKIKNPKNYEDKFAYNISLLQAIYIHQDFIEELLSIFKCNITKGDLKKDINYSINRDLRNELIGHPFRKNNGEFISSTTFGYNPEKDTILYLRYHKDNNFEFEKVSYSIPEIIDRHKKFLNLYFDKILNKLKSILNRFTKEIEKLEKVVDTKDFQTVINFSSAIFESIFKFDFIYDKESLIKIYNKKEENFRYKNLINRFYDDLKSNLNETKFYINSLFETKEEIKFEPSKIPDFNIIFSTDAIGNTESKEQKITYHYELGKLSTKRNYQNFEFFSDLLKYKCSENEIVLNELKHMENNFYSEIEYYSSLRLIYTTLNEE